MSIDLRGGNELNKLLAELAGIYPLVTYRAINKTVAKGKTLVSRKIRDEINLSAAYVGKKLRTVNATQTSLSGRISTDKRGILLSRFASSRLSVKARSNPNYLTGYPAMSDGETSYRALSIGRRLSQMSVKVSASGGRYRGKFFPIRLKGSGAIGLAVRVGTGKNDYDIKYGPSPSQVFNRLKPDLEAELAVEYEVQFAAQLDYQLSRLRNS